MTAETARRRRVIQIMLLGAAPLVLPDLDWPDLSGLDILRRAGANDDLKAATVVVPAATDDEQEIRHCHEPGRNVYIANSVNRENFANAIRQLGLFFSVIQVPQASK